MALAVLVAHGGSVVGNEKKWWWFCSGFSSSLCRETNLFFPLLFFCFCLLFLLSLSLFCPPRPSVFSFSFLSSFCLSDLLSLFVIPCFLLSILFCFSPLFFDYFSLLPGSLFLIFSKCSLFYLIVSFFSKSFSLNKTPSYVPYFVRLCIFSQNLPHLFSFLFF